ncbi:MAG: hypothetical protein KF693_05165 [Nitrospira sp.]|nr:hypothetical protein [Nitrospira sp.]
MATKKQSVAKTRLKKSIPTYPGPYWPDLNALTDAEVDQAYRDLNVKPRPLPCEHADDARFVTAYGDREEPIEWTPGNPVYDWTPEEVKALRQRIRVWYRGCLKVELYNLYIERWVATLSDTECWSIIADVEGKRPSISEQRYTSREQLRQQTQSVVYQKSPATTAKAEATTHTQQEGESMKCN